MKNPELMQKILLENGTGQLTMPTPLRTTIFISVLVACIFPHHEIDAQLMATSDTPGPISQLLQLVWEPSSLIRMWTALDQLYNVALGWRSAARQIAHLPFRQGRALDSHVRIQEPRRYSLQKKQSSDMPHWDWFKKVYEEGASDNVQESMSAEGSHRHNLQMSAQQPMKDPVLSGNVFRQYLNALRGGVYNPLNDPAASGSFLQESFSNLKDMNTFNSIDGTTPNNNFLQHILNAQRGNVHNSLSAPGVNALLSLQQLPMLPGVGNINNGVQMDIRYPHVLPPHFNFQPQEVFVDHNMVEYPNIDASFRRTVKVPPGSMVRNEGNSANGRQRINRAFNSNVPPMFFNSNGVPNTNPETRLRMFLKLMGKLGEIHKKSVKAVEFDDDSSTDSVNNELPKSR